MRIFRLLEGIKNQSKNLKVMYQFILFLIVSVLTAVSAHAHSANGNYSIPIAENHIKKPDFKVILTAFYPLSNAVPSTDSEYYFISIKDN